MNFSVFKGTEEDSVGKPLYSRFIKDNDFKGVPHPLSKDYTPKPQEEIDESLYVYGKKGPQEPEPSVLDDRSSEYSTCQSNDSAGSIRTSSEHSVDLESEISRVPSEVYVSTLITTNEKGVSASKSKEVEPSCVSHIKSPRQPIKDQETPKVNRKNWNDIMERELGEGYSFTKKKCFVYGSLSHLIKDYDYYEKKMAREVEFKKQRVFNTANANRVNHANQFVHRPVQLKTGRPNINSVRTNINTGRTNINSVRTNINTGRININSVRTNINTGRTNINSVRTNINTGRTNINSVRSRVNIVTTNVNTVRSKPPVPTTTSNSFSPKRLQVNQFNQKRHFSKSYSSVRRPFAKTTAHSHAVKGNWDLLLRPQHVIIGGTLNQTPIMTVDQLLLELTIDKGRRYKSRKETKGKKVVTSLDFQEEVSTRYAEEVNTGSIKVGTVSGQVSTDSIKKTIHSPDKGQREGKASMIIEEAHKRTKEQI
ncbi:hypothetical protein Tco_0950001, partial [Tanacetum coccineum]